MKKVLIISPLAQENMRLSAFSKYLPKFGWEPTMLPRCNPRRSAAPSATRERLFSKIGFDAKRSFLDQFQKKYPIFHYNIAVVRRLKRAYREVTSYPDIFRDWRKEIYKLTDNLCDRNKYDALLSIGPPVSSHIIAHQLKRKYGIPWVADFMDLWSENHYYRYSSIRHFFDRRLELKVLSNVDRIITVSASCAKRQSQLHQKKMIIITNGFDPEDMDSLNSRLDKKFTLTYAGALYKGKQDPTMFFRAISNLIKKRMIDKSDLSVLFYGTDQPLLRHLTDQYELNSVIHYHDRTSRAESIKIQRHSQVLLAFGWNDPAKQDLVPSKVYDYLMAQRPILLIGGQRSERVKTIIEDAQAGASVYDCDHLEKVLVQYYKEYKQQGNVNYSGLIENVEYLSFVPKTEKLSDVLDHVCGAKL